MGKRKWTDVSKYSLAFEILFVYLKCFQPKVTKDLLQFSKVIRISIIATEDYTPATIIERELEFPLRSIIKLRAFHHINLAPFS